MWALLCTTIFTSAADSLNPFAITQQFVLQGMVKKPKHIWYFIIPTGVVNLIGGFFAYFGLVALMGSYFRSFVQSHRPVLLAVECILGIAFCIWAVCLVRNNKRDVRNRPREHHGEVADEKNEEQKAVRKIKSVSPVALMLLGAGATISELTTALPYFAFLAVLFNYKLSIPQVTGILVLYNLIYMLPLMLLYVVYVKAQDKFDRLYLVIKRQVARCADILAPALTGVIGVGLTAHAATLLL